MANFDSHNKREYTDHRQGECWCQRESSLRPLDRLQKRAYGRIRSTVLLAFGRVVPTEVSELLFEYTMAAEEIPLDPRVDMPGVTNAEKFFLLVGTPSKPFQRFVRKRYRCPQYQRDFKDESEEGEQQRFDGPRPSLVCRGGCFPNGRKASVRRCCLREEQRRYDSVLHPLTFVASCLDFFKSDIRANIR